MKMTIYLPDDLATEVRDKLGDTNVSAVCQAALRAELDRSEARARIAAEGFGRTEVYDSKDDRDVAFQGRQIGYADYLDQTAYLTPKGSIAVYAGHQERLYTYSGYSEFAADDHPEELRAGVARALGEKYVEELDI